MQRLATMITSGVFSEEKSSGMFGYSWCVRSVLGSQVFGQASMESCGAERGRPAHLCVQQWFIDFFVMVYCTGSEESEAGLSNPEVSDGLINPAGTCRLASILCLNWVVMYFYFKPMLKYQSGKLGYFSPGGLGPPPAASSSIVRGRRPEGGPPGPASEGAPAGTTKTVT